ncbi:hypothetical protein CTA2_1509, partial [Colletotrichum tanaceti]
MRADNDDHAALSVDEDFPRDNEEPSSTAFAPPPLPQLTNEPQTLPDSCVSVSRPFLRALHALLPHSPHLTLSIGSGTGLVEALLHDLAPPPKPNLVSVEVAPSPNRFHAAHRTVPGTWALDPLAARARAWLFVYPKQVALVRAYVEAFLGRRDAEAEVDVVVYVGPRMDWDDFRCAL